MSRGPNHALLSRTMQIRSQMVAAVAHACCADKNEDDTEKIRIICDELNQLDSEVQGDRADDEDLVWKDFRRMLISSFDLFIKHLKQPDEAK